MLEPQTGTRNDGTAWHRQDFIFEYFENPTDRWSDKVLLTIMNERIQEVDMHVGDEFRIGFSHRIREYQGRVFNDIVLYKIEKVVATQQQPASLASQPAWQPQQGNIFNQQPGTQPQQPVTGGGNDGVPL